MPAPARRDRRIYAYVCRYNNGNAPNLWRGNFTLAACKGPIRKHARPGDVVIGFQQKDGLAPLFAFRVEERLEWPAYVRRCEDSLRGSELFPLVLLCLSHLLQIWPYQQSAHGLLLLQSCGRQHTLWETAT